MALFYLPLLLLLLPFVEPCVSPPLRAAAATSHGYSPCCAAAAAATSHGYSPCCAAAAATSHGYSPCCAAAVGRTITLDFYVHPATAASSTRCIGTRLETEPRAWDAEMAGSDSGMVRAAPPQPERSASTTADDPAAAAIHRISALPSTVSAAPLCLRCRFVFLGTAYAPHSEPTATVRIQAGSIRFCLPSQRGGPFSIFGLLERNYCAPEWFANLTVFALYGEAIIVGGGGPLLRGNHDCVQALRSVPGHRISGVPPLADEGQYLVVTHDSALDEVNESGSGMSADAMYAHFPLLRGWVDDNDGATNATSERTDWEPPTLWAIGLIPAFLIPLGNYFFGRRTMSAYRHEDTNGRMRIFHVCDNCWVRPVSWVASCCHLCLCSECFAFVFLRRHSCDISDRPCENPGVVGVLNEDRIVVFEKNNDYYQSSNIEMDVEQIPYKSPDPAAKLQLRVFTGWRDLYARCRPPRTLKIKIIEHNGQVRQWRKVHLAPKNYTIRKIPLVMRWIGWED